MLFDISIVKRLATDIRLDFVSDHSVTALVGPSGIGKTTMLNAVAGIVRPDWGRIAVAGRVLFDAATAIDLPPEQRRCGYVFQDDRLFPHMSVKRNLLYGFNRTAPEKRWAAFEEVVHLLGLDHVRERKPRFLSGGEARRVAIGRALLSGPDFLLMDEPLNSLDADRREAMLSAIERIRDTYAVPILYVSHQQDEIARLAGHTVTMGEKTKDD